MRTLRKVVERADDLQKVTVTEAIREHWRDEWHAALLELIRAEIAAAKEPT